MNAKSAYFTNSKQETSKHTTAIVPLVSEDKQLNKIFLIGTAFYISNLGILMTAKHNLFNRDNELFDNLGVYHFLPDNHYILRPVRGGAYNDEYDIAYLLPEQIIHKGTEIVSSDALVLTDKQPVMNEQLATYGYPDSRLDEFELHFIAEFYLGNCREYHPEGFSILKNPCFQTTIHIKSGASGGPVFDKEGRVFAICSTGFEFGDDGENVSFVTPILPSLNLVLDDGLNKRTVLELIEQNIINFEKSSDN